MRQDLCLQALERASRIKGGSARLAEHLEVKPWIIEMWQQGKARIPPVTLLRIIDVVIDEDVT